QGRLINGFYSKKKHTLLVSHILDAEIVPKALFVDLALPYMGTVTRTISIALPDGTVEERPNQQHPRYVAQMQAELDEWKEFKAYLAELDAAPKVEAEPEAEVEAEGDGEGEGEKKRRKKKKAKKEPEADSVAEREREEKRRKTRAKRALRVMRILQQQK
ncbi:hypothetical protein KIPB_012290, partial [Kipferlia bialata]